MGIQQNSLRQVLFENQPEFLSITQKVDLRLQGSRKLAVINLAK
jgi:hypothetical protein